MKLAIVVAHAGADSLPDAFRSWVGQEFEVTRPPDTNPPVYVVNGSSGMLSAYQDALKIVPAEYDILAYCHDDMLCTEPHQDVWPRVLKEFEDPTVGLVGFGGALIHGSPDLYRTPYNLQQLGRGLYRSNVEDAEVHGERFTGSCDVAVLDGFALIVRRSVLDRAGGWPIETPISYVGYDYWLACTTHRMGLRVRLVGVRCLHLGGRTAVALKKASSGEDYEKAHRYISENFADVLPCSVA